MQSIFNVKQLQNEKGFVLISAMLFLILLTTIGIMATDTTNVELQIASNDRMIKQDFYNQEMGLAVARINSTEWLTSAYVTEPVNTAHFPKANPADVNDVNDNEVDDRSEITNSNGEIVSIYKVRNIVSPASDVNAWDDVSDFESASEHPANQLPVLEHEDKPPVGSGYDPKNFYIRRFATTVYSPNEDRKVILQEGLYKAFNKN
jgi:Tfp pilus assembly protein PilX